MAFEPDAAVFDRITPHPEGVDAADELVHERAYVVRAYVKDDRTLALRGAVRDQKPPGLYVPADPEPMTIHHMIVDLEIEVPSLVITKATAVLNVHPHLTCKNIEPHYGNLVGLSIARGFTHKVRELFGGPRGCTHTTALLQAMAPVAVQSMWSFRMRAMRASGGMSGGMSGGPRRWARPRHARRACGPTSTPATSGTRRASTSPRCGRGSPWRSRSGSRTASPSTASIPRPGARRRADAPVAARHERARNRDPPSAPGMTAPDPHAGHGGAPVTVIGPGDGRTVLVVTAHADDAALFIGGTVAAWSANGWRVVLVRVTDDRWDSVGLDEPTTIAANAAELRDAARALGVAEVVDLGYPTDVLGDVSEVGLREHVIRLVRTHRPYALVSFDPYAMYGEDNQDHVKLAAAVDESFWTSQFDLHHPSTWLPGSPRTACSSAGTSVGGSWR